LNYFAKTIGNLYLFVILGLGTGGSNPFKLFFILKFFSVVNFILILVTIIAKKLEKNKSMNLKTKSTAERDFELKS
jgi:hypothetical protein